VLTAGLGVVGTELWVLPLDSMGGFIRALWLLAISLLSPSLARWNNIYSPVNLDHFDKIGYWWLMCCTLYCCPLLLAFTRDIVPYWNQLKHTRGTNDTIGLAYVSKFSLNSYGFVIDPAWWVMRTGQAKAGGTARRSRTGLWLSHGSRG